MNKKELGQGVKMNRIKFNYLDEDVKKQKNSIKYTAGIFLTMLGLGTGIMFYSTNKYIGSLENQIKTYQQNTKQQIDNYKQTVENKFQIYKIKLEYQNNNIKRLENQIKEQKQDYKELRSQLLNK